MNILDHEHVVLKFSNNTEANRQHGQLLQIANADAYARMHITILSNRQWDWEEVWPCMHGV